jgi:hypothetical protein
LTRAAYSGNHTFGTDVWFTEAGGGFQTLHNTGHSYVGFGSRPAAVLDPEGAARARVQRGPTGRLENHVYDNYILMPVVSFHCEPLSLRWNAAQARYEWLVSTKTATIATNQVGGGGTGEQWVLTIKWSEVHPCFLAGYTDPYSAANAGRLGGQRGRPVPELHLPAAGSDVQVPDFGGAVFKPYTYAQGDFRDPLIAYAASSNAPAIWSLDFESLSPTISSPALPTPQKNPFDPPGSRRPSGRTTPATGIRFRP